MANVESTIRDLVATHNVVLFMKGSRHFPQCGFSAQVIEILNQLTVPYETVNVLEDPELRDGIKRYSDWPTIPQLYVGGSFVGGCDIVKEMFANGELASTLGVSPAPAEPQGPPAITVTPRAAAAIKAAREADTDELRLVISAGFENELFFDGPEPGDLVVVAGGVTLRIDPKSARRANGVSIDFVDTAGGFKVDNPNEPPRVRGITPKVLRAALDAKEPFTIFDVRTDGERTTAHLQEAVALDDAGQKRLAGLPKSTQLVFMCHHGMRSRVAAEAALRQGFTSVWNLEGGIDAWSTEVDASVPRY
jgi:monothiol glutaredoxin